VARSKNLVLAEFAVTVRENGVEWDGLDAVLWRLIHAKPRGGFLPQVRTARGRRVQRGRS
jgi:hypothetical protein